MGRKSTKLSEEKLKAMKALSDLEEQEEKAVKEESEELKTIEEAINKLVEAKKMFCGVILSKDDILSILSLSIDNKGENIKIPFKVYYND